MPDYLYNVHMSGERLFVRPGKDDEQDDVGAVLNADPLARAYNRSTSFDLDSFQF
jgi:hypothetical protein